MIKPGESIHNSKNIISSLMMYATQGSAGMDVQAQENTLIMPRKSIVLPVGLCLNLPEDYCVQVCSRSGLAAKHQIIVLNSPGIIDRDFKDEIKVILMNHSDKSFEIKKGMRVAQLLLIKYFHLIPPQNDERRGGFGSTRGM